MDMAVAGPAHMQDRAEPLVAVEAPADTLEPVRTPWNKVMARVGTPTRPQSSQRDSLRISVMGYAA